jgi:hypothetical protein
MLLFNKLPHGADNTSFGLTCLTPINGYKEGQGHAKLPLEVCVRWCVPVGTWFACTQAHGQQHGQHRPLSEERHSLHSCHHSVCLRVLSGSL